MTESGELLQQLNAAQRAAVEFCEGPSLVIAGAGSGKTRVLTYKIAYLLNRGMEPESIMALTFTNKAAREMKDRIGQLLGDDRARRLWMGTFHSVFLRILRREHERIGFSSHFTIYDEADSRSLLRGIMREMELDEKVYKPGVVAKRIGMAKNRLAGAEGYMGDADQYQADLRAGIPKTGAIFQLYEHRKRNADAMDFDDILFYTFRLFDACPDVLAHYVSRFRFVLVDEYQDTNYAQHRIVWQLTHERQRLCVVGDDAQSIYSFRGADIDNILSFRQLYPNCRLFKLEQNYRSTQTIVEAANSLIHVNQGQIFKNVFSEREQGEKIEVMEAYSDVEEGKIVIRKIQELRMRRHLHFSDFAILYRTNAQSRIFEEELTRNAYPYRIYGGQSFYQRKEIKDLIAYFRLVVNRNDAEAFKRVVNVPARGIGTTTVQKILTCADQHDTGVWDVMAHAGKYQLNVNRGTLEKLARFRDMIDELHDLSLQSDAAKVGMAIVQRSGMRDDIMRDTSAEGLARQENATELMGAMETFCEERREEGNEHVLLTDYLSEVSLLSDIDSGDTEDVDRVTLMTVHAAKGLEFNTVFVVGMEEHLFPSQLAEGSQRQLEEERRLFYVALTRAQCRCFITFAKSRFRFGKMEFDIQPSAFIADIDPQYLQVHRAGSAFRADRGATLELPWNNSRSTMRPSQSASQPFPKSVSIPSRGKLQPLRNLSQPSPTERSGGMEHRSKFSDGQSVNAPSQKGAGQMLSVGCHIEHERFGYGEVTAVEGTGERTKATVKFSNAGTKQLLLKYARFRLVD